MLPLLIAIVRSYSSYRFSIQLRCKQVGRTGPTGGGCGRCEAWRGGVVVVDRRPTSHAPSKNGNGNMERKETQTRSSQRSGFSSSSHANTFHTYCLARDAVILKPLTLLADLQRRLLVRVRANTPSPPSPAPAPRPPRPSSRRAITQHRPATRPPRARSSRGAQRPAPASHPPPFLFLRPAFRRLQLRSPGTPA